MADMEFNDVSELKFEVQWDDGLGQPLLKCINEGDNNGKDLGNKDLATDNSSKKASEPASVTVTVTMDAKQFSVCHVDDVNNTKTPWPGGTKTIRLESGDEDREITFTVSVNTKGDKQPGEQQQDGWYLKETKPDGTMTWVLDPYIRLTRAGYTIKSRQPPSVAAAQ